MSLPPVIEMKVPDAVPVLVGNIDGLGLKKFVLCITRDIPDDDLVMLKDYGKVLDYNHTIHNNLDPATFTWDFLVIDLRESGDRYFLMKQILPFRAKYHVIEYVALYEDAEFIKDPDNRISSFPKKQARLEDFELLLLQDRVKKPLPWYVSLFSCVLKAYHQVKN